MPSWPSTPCAAVLVLMGMGGCASSPRATAGDLGADGTATSEPRTDSGPRPRDAGVSDASAPDGRASDAGAPDADVDAGPDDAGTPDAGTGDAGPCVAPPGAGCDPVRQLGCADGEACIVTDATGGVACQSTFGSRGFGVACTEDDPCVPRAVCVVPSGGGILQCRQLCETTASASCTRIRDFPACLGVFFPPTISGGSYFGP